MKQAVLALTSLLSSVLGLSDAKAANIAQSMATDNTPNKLSVSQQKAIFTFSRDCASFTMALIERWQSFSQEEREASTREFLDAFFAAVTAHPDADAVRSDLGTSLLMADTLGNAKYLLEQEGKLSPEALNEAVEAVKASIMRACHEYNGEVVVPYIPARRLWGQHGQHFVRPKRKYRGLHNRWRRRWH